MSMIADKLSELALTLADLKTRVRVAVAKEIAGAVAETVKDVVGDLKRFSLARLVVCHNRHVRGALQDATR